MRTIMMRAMERKITTRETTTIKRITTIAKTKTITTTTLLPSNHRVHI